MIQVSEEARWAVWGLIVGYSLGHDRLRSALSLPPLFALA